MSAAPLTLEALAARFTGPVKRDSRGLHVFCPAHADGATSGRQSLRLTETTATGGLHVKCWAGCSEAAILSAVGLTVRDLAPAVAQNGAATSSARLVATYDYTDGAGALRYQVVRFTPKTFRQRRPDGRGGWTWNLDGVERVLYRLPDLVEQPRVVFVEGEKDADRLAGLGLVATTSPGGSSAWRDTYAAQLADLGAREVIILPDNDPPGAQYAATVAAACTGAGLTAKVVALPGLAPKQDVSDWLDAGHAREELEALITAWTPAAPPMLGVGLGEFLARSFPEEAPLIGGVLTADGCGWIAGEEKLGKTYFALEEGLGLALGDPVAGRFAVPARQRVVFIEEEDPPRRAHRRLSALLRGRGLDPTDPDVRRDLDQWFRIEVWSGFSLDDPAWLARLDATCAAFHPAVVYLDVLRKLTTRDLNKADQAGALLASLDTLRRKHGVLFRVLHHFRKVQSFRVGRGSQEMGGSFVLGAWGECSLFFEPIGRKPGTCRVSVQVKDGPPVPGFTLAFYAEGPRHAPTLVRLTAEEEADDTSADDVVLQAVATLPKTEPAIGLSGVSIKALGAALKKGDKTVRRALKRLTAEKRVLVTGKATSREDLYGVIE